MNNNTIAAIAIFQEIIDQIQESCIDDLSPMTTSGMAELITSIIQANEMLSIDA